MNDAAQQHIPVLIVGAGPAGLASAATLAHHGVPSLLVDRRATTSNLPRATGVSTRSMEILRSFGLEDEVRSGAIDAVPSLWGCDTLADAASGFRIAVGYPSREQAQMVSPTAPACVPQDHLEPVMERHLLAGGL